MKSQDDLFGAPVASVRENIEEQFSVFWVSYPNRKGKGDARKAFEKAIKKTSLDIMLKGITDYVANKPSWQAYKHPGPWLRGEHWNDEWEPQQARVAFQGTVNTNETREQHLSRVALFDRYRLARDEGNHELASRLREQMRAQA